MSATLDIKTALYFEDRARRTRSETDRARFLVVARKYRDLAAKREDDQLQAGSDSHAHKSS
jgi:hypothetical protein